MADNNRNWRNQSQQSNRDWEGEHREEPYRERSGFGNEYDQSMRNQYESRKYGVSGRKDYEGYGQDRYSRGDERYESMSDRPYGSRNYEGREEDNPSYGSSGRYGYRGDYGGSGYSGQRGYGTGMGFGNEYRGQQDWRKQSAGYGTFRDDSGYRGYSGDYGSQYGEETYRGRGDRSRNIYGGDTSNYGNASQGGYDRGWWDRTRDEVSSWFGDEDAERRRRMDDQKSGLHRGKGPKDYHRSEDRIREDVCDRLTDDDRLDASNIQVQVQGNDVILTGNVNDRDQKRRAEDLVESISGVQNVENRIRVGRSGETGTDTGRSTSTERGRNK